LIEILPVSTLPDTNTIVTREAGVGKLKFTAPAVMREERKEKIATLNSNIPCEAGAEKIYTKQGLNLHIDQQHINSRRYFLAYYTRHNLIRKEIKSVIQ
jgi:hypothetical protein